MSANRRQHIDGVLARIEHADALEQLAADLHQAALDAKVRVYVYCSECAGGRGRHPVAKVVTTHEHGLVLLARRSGRRYDTKGVQVPPSEYRSRTGSRLGRNVAPYPVAGHPLNPPTPDLECPHHGVLDVDLAELRTAAMSQLGAARVSFFPRRAAR